MAGHYQRASLTDPNASQIFVPETKPEGGPYGFYDNPSNAQSSFLNNETFPLKERTGGNPYRDSEASAYSTRDELDPPFQVPVATRGAPLQRPKSSRKLMIGCIILALLILALVIVLPIYFVVIRPKSDASNTGNSSGGAQTNGPSGTADAPEPSNTTPARLTRGGDDSEVTMSNGTTFTYRNRLGGIWVHDPEDPFNLDAYPNSFTPPLNTSWRWGFDRVYGVNLGGLFVLEPFINPDVFQAYPGAVDEYTLTELMRAEGPRGLDALERHYQTFITEQDIAEIAAAGLNWLRVPIGFWAIETYDGEPFLERVSWKYFLQIVEWARKYGLRIYLDLHAVPGSQNAMNHSARRGQINFLAGNMGLANAQRTLYYLRILVQFISQPQYKDVIPMFGIVNEPQSRGIGQETLRSFYLEAYNMIREITGFGEGNGPYIVVGDGFRVTQEWLGLMPNADRFVVDAHPYLAFDEGGPNLDPLDVPAPGGGLGGNWPLTACQRWSYINETKSQLGVTIGGEFSAAINDCGLFLREVDRDSVHPQCELYNDYRSWSPELKQGLRAFVDASFDVIGDFFFWTWKIGPSRVSGQIETPFWSYELGLREGWIPRDPRESIGKCAEVGFVPTTTFDGNYQPWHTGAVQNPVIPAEYVAANPWPPAVLLNTSFGDGNLELLPTYVATASPVITLPVEASLYSGVKDPSVTQGLDGWTNDNDRELAVGPIEGCDYPDTWRGEFDELPTVPCTVESAGGADDRRRRRRR